MVQEKRAERKNLVLFREICIVIGVSNVRIRHGPLHTAIDRIRHEFCD